MRLFGKSALGGAEGIRRRKAYNFSEYLRQTDRKRTALWRAKAPTEQPAFECGESLRLGNRANRWRRLGLLYFFVLKQKGSRLDGNDRQPA